jgi:hypothetical protein
MTALWFQVGEEAVMPPKRKPQLRPPPDPDWRGQLVTGLFSETLGGEASSLDEVSNRADSDTSRVLRWHLRQATGRLLLDILRALRILVWVGVLSLGVFLVRMGFELTPRSFVAAATACVTPFLGVRVQRWVRRWRRRGSRRGG